MLLHYIMQSWTIVDVYAIMCSFANAKSRRETDYFFWLCEIKILCFTTQAIIKLAISLDLSSSISGSP